MKSYIKGFILIFCSLGSVIALASDTKYDLTVKQVVEDGFYESGTCDKYVSNFTVLERTVLNNEAASRLLIEDLVVYVMGGRSLYESTHKNFSEGLKEKVANEGLMPEKVNYSINYFDAFMDKRKLSSNNSDVKSYTGFIKSFSGERDKQVDLFNVCETIASLLGKGRHSVNLREYNKFVAERPMSVTVGHFEVAHSGCEVSKVVGTGNRFSEPEAWQGSRFLIINSSFKNLDSESRMPSEGRVYISYNGKEYEFDSTETILLKGYNLWFKQINPLLTMKTKIVYRIPDEIEGEAFWEPGRNTKGQRLWCGNISAAS